MGPFWGILAYIYPRYTIPIRARAYNDCVRDAVLLKTASNQVSRAPKWSILGPSDGTDSHGTDHTRISLYSGFGLDVGYSGVVSGVKTASIHPVYTPPAHTQLYIPAHICRSPDPTMYSNIYTCHLPCTPCSAVCTYTDTHACTSYGHIGIHYTNTDTVYTELSPFQPVPNPHPAPLSPDPHRNHPNQGFRVSDIYDPTSHSTWVVYLVSSATNTDMPTSYTCHLHTVSQHPYEPSRDITGILICPSYHQLSATPTYLQIHHHHEPTRSGHHVPVITHRP